MAVTRVFEVHPEGSFQHWNGVQPFYSPKHSGFGFAERLRLVEQAFPGVAERIRKAWPARDVSDDDILDALAAGERRSASIVALQCALATH